LDEYFDGRRKRFDIPFSLSGTNFQKQVWKELSKIPFGKTVSYKDIARKIKNPKAVRAVGSANGKNPMCIIIPCHRVIAADGSIGGYSGGITNKQKLLRFEGINRP
jgi:methylated-DNA-[protein]-cysteine S-methyltransferase